MVEAKSFQCPNCGSPLMVNSMEKEVKCAYCGSTVIVPGELRDQPLSQSQADFTSPQHQQWLLQNGADAVARVESVEDTDYIENMNPVVVIDLWVTPASGAPYGTTIPLNIPRTAIPRVGDKFKVKYNPAEVMDIRLPPFLLSEGK
jgi:DNA-directed RNA polymerase subunit RPC12/RpoP